MAWIFIQIHCYGGVRASEKLSSVDVASATDSTSENRKIILWRIKLLSWAHILRLSINMKVASNSQFALSLLATHSHFHLPVLSLKIVRLSRRSPYVSIAMLSRNDTRCQGCLIFIYRYVNFQSTRCICFTRTGQLNSLMSYTWQKLSFEVTIIQCIEITGLKELDVSIAREELSSVNCDSWPFRISCDLAYWNVWQLFFNGFFYGFFNNLRLTWSIWTTVFNH